MKRLKILFLMQIITALIISNLNAKIITDTLESKVEPIDKVIMYIEKTNEIFINNFHNPIQALKIFTNYYEANLPDFLYAIGQVAVEKQEYEDDSPEFNNFIKKKMKLNIVLNTSKYLDELFRINYQNIEEVDEYWNSNMKLRFSKHYLELLTRMVSLKESDEFED